VAAEQALLAQEQLPQELLIEVAVEAEAVVLELDNSADSVAVMAALE
jgi:hypothetical protein